MPKPPKNDPGITLNTTTARRLQLLHAAAQAAKAVADAATGSAQSICDQFNTLLNAVKEANGIAADTPCEINFETGVLSPGKGG